MRSRRVLIVVLAAVVGFGGCLLATPTPADGGVLPVGIDPKKVLYKVDDVVGNLAEIVKVIARKFNPKPKEGLKPKIGVNFVENKKQLTFNVSGAQLIGDCTEAFAWSGKYWHGTSSIRFGGKNRDTMDVGGTWMHDLPLGEGGQGTTAEFHFNVKSYRTPKVKKTSNFPMIAGAPALLKHRLPEHQNLVDRFTVKLTPQIKSTTICDWRLILTADHFAIPPGGGDQGEQASEGQGEADQGTIMKPLSNIFFDGGNCGLEGWKHQGAGEDPVKVVEHPGIDLERPDVDPNFGANVAQLTYAAPGCGTPTELSQTFDAPPTPYDLGFDYEFTTSYGQLEVLVSNGESEYLLSTLEACTSPTSIWSDHVVTVDDENFFGLPDVELIFRLTGGEEDYPAQVLLDTIGFVGDSAGIEVEVVIVPEPSVLVLAALGLLSLLLINSH